MYRNRYGRAGTAGTAADRLPNWALPVALLVNTPTPVMFDHLGHFDGDCVTVGEGGKSHLPFPEVGRSLAQACASMGTAH